MIPINAKTYSMDISATNPAWGLSHELKNLYGLTDLSPSSFDSLGDRLKTDSALAIKYE